MRYDSERREAFPKGRGVCPGCARPLIAKCGEIVTAHWAHSSGVDCDPWYDPAAHEWHLEWQRRHPPECSEIVMGPHRADLVVDDYVIELQHSPLAVAEIREREAFYGRKLLWIWDARAFASRLSVRKYDPRTGQLSFRWKHPRKSMFSCTARVWWDLGGGWILQNVRSKQGTYAAGMGWGTLTAWVGEDWKWPHAVPTGVFE